VSHVNLVRPSFVHHRVFSPPSSTMPLPALSPEDINVVNEPGQASERVSGGRQSRGTSDHDQRDGDANDEGAQQGSAPYGPVQGTCNCPTLHVGPRASFGLAPRCGRPRFRTCALCAHTPCLRHTVEVYQEPVIGSPIDGMLAGVCQCCESDRRPHWRATSSRSNE
jgi:hypothetical protein